MQSSLQQSNYCGFHCNYPSRHPCQWLLINRVIGIPSVMLCHRMPSLPTAYLRLLPVRTGDACQRRSVIAFVHFETHKRRKKCLRILRKEDSGALVFFIIDALAFRTQRRQKRHPGRSSSIPKEKEKKTSMFLVLYDHLTTTPRNKASVWKAEVDQKLTLRSHRRGTISWPDSTLENPFPRKEMRRTLRQSQEPSDNFQVNITKQKVHVYRREMYFTGFLVYISTPRTFGKDSKWHLQCRPLYLKIKKKCKKSYYYNKWYSIDVFHVQQ